MAGRRGMAERGMKDSILTLREYGLESAAARRFRHDQECPE
jgi:hypothetical protein